VKFVATKKRYDNKFFSPLSFVAVFGAGIRDPESGMGKNQDKRPGSATLVRWFYEAFVAVLWILIRVHATVLDPDQ
jgi:hypothetical protein